MFDDGSARVVEMGEGSSPDGSKFTVKPDNGDYFLINANGDLEWWDEDGRFMTLSWLGVQVESEGLIL